jgi:hypothetical protein
VKFWQYSFSSSPFLGSSPFLISSRQLSNLLLKFSTLSLSLSHTHTRSKRHSLLVWFRFPLGKRKWREACSCRRQILGRGRVTFSLSFCPYFLVLLVDLVKFWQYSFSSSPFLGSSPFLISSRQLSNLLLKFSTLYLSLSHTHTFKEAFSAGLV